jgi:hypothetical protein
MKAEYRIAQPDDVDCTLSITMAASEWKRLLDQVDSSAYPGWRIKDAIERVIRTANAKFSETGEYAP